MTQEVPSQNSTDRESPWPALGGAAENPAILAFGPDDVERCRFGDLDRLAGRIASGLRREGVKSTHCVALLAPPSIAYVAAALGILRTGATVVPVDAQMADKPLRHVLEDCRPRIVFSDERGARRLGKLEIDDKPRIVRLDREDGDDSWRELMDDEPASGTAPDGDDTTAVLFYTSGTTGPPKGVPLSRGNLAYQFEILEENRLIESGDRLLLPLPLHHVYPFVCGMLAPLHLGLAIVLPSALTGPQLVRAIREGEVSVVIGVPRLHRALVDGIRGRAEGGGLLQRMVFRAALGTSLAARKRFGMRLGRTLFGSLHRRLGGKVRLMASGGSPLDPELARQLEAFGWHVAIGYGLTETSPLLTILRPGDPRFETVGRPVQKTEIRIDPSSAPGESDTPRDTDDPHSPGEVLARGPGVFQGYHKLAKETEAAFSDGWYRTGDYGRFDHDGYLRIEGRINTMLVLEGGENIAPETLEEIYGDCGEIEEAGIFQREGKLVALIVPGRSVPENDARKHVAAAVDRIGENLPSYQRLSDFRISSHPLPRTRLGKIRRHELVESYDGTHTDSAPQTGPVDIEEMAADDQSLLDNKQARRLWEYLCRRYADHRLEPESRLGTDLGIDSIEWVELSGTLEEQLGLSFSEKMIQESRTVHDLLEIAAGSETRSPGESRRALRDPESVLDDADRSWLQPRSTVLNVLGRPLYWIHDLFMRTYFRIELRGRENLPASGPYVLAPNHTSFLDAPALAAALDFQTVRRYFWAGVTKTMFRNRFWRAVSRLGQVVPIDPERGPVASLAIGAAVLQRDHPLVWFPEGAIASDGKLRDFRPGLGLILEHHPVPALPVAIEGTHAALPLGQRFPRRGRIVIRIGQPLDPGELARKGPGDTPHERIVNGLHQAVAQMQESTGTSSP